MRAVMCAMGQTPPFMAIAETMAEVAKNGNKQNSGSNGLFFLPYLFRRAFGKSCNSPRPSFLDYRDPMTSGFT